MSQAKTPPSEAKNRGGDDGQARPASDTPGPDRDTSQAQTLPRDRRGARRPADRGRLSGPGTLQSDDVGIISPDAEGALLAQYALENGLRPSAQRPAIPEYMRQLWRRVHFIIAFATARNIAMYTEAKLGQLWQVLTPLLNAGVYFLVFGQLLHINRGIPNYLGFLVTGVFVFNFTQRAFISSSTVITSSLPLIRALQFPRAALPLAYVVIELQQMILSMIVLVPILLATHEPVTWYWLLAIPALVLQSLFNLGSGLLVARLGSQNNDFSQLLPFLMRTWLYLSGVIFSIQTLAASYTQVAILQLNPAALYITLVRNALMQTERSSVPGSKPYNQALCHVWKTLGHQKGASIQYQSDSAYCHYVGANPAHFWYYAIGWAVLAVVVGFWFFWRAETKYGRG
ncbi:MAG TPA: ABC transporter permease [Streptosporangiaceae bacterium]|nr:ABC transporter permease [Streptosporangiaceae bacterium]